MAFVRRDFVKETSTITGIGAITLAGARAPAQTFGSVCANGDTFRYAISNQSGPNEWEVGLGTYNSGANTITRSPVASSNGGGLVNFSAGTKFVDMVVDTAQYNAFLTTAGGGGAAISAAGNSVSAGTVVFTNSNGVSFGMAGSTVSASMDAFRSVSLVTFPGAISQSITNATDLTISGSNLVFARPPGTMSSNLSGANVNFFASGQSLAAAAWIEVAASLGAGKVQNLSFNFANAVSFGIDTTTSAGSNGAIARITAIAPRLRQIEMFNLNATQQQSVSLATDSTLSNASAFTLNLPVVSAGGVNDQNFSSANVFFKLSSDSLLGMVNVRYVGGTITATNNIAQAQQLSFSDANGVSFGLNTVTTAALGRVVRLSVSYAREIGLVSHIGGNVVSSVTQLAFSNASNVTWSLSTAANAATVLASVAAGGGGGITNINVSAGTTSQNLSNVVFSNSNNVSFGLNGSTITATVTVATSLSNINVSAGTTSQNLSAVVFSNSNNVSFGLNGSTVTATATVATSLSNINISAGTTSQNLSNVVFSNSNGVSFGLNGSTVTASVAAAGGGTTLSGFKPYQGEMVSNAYGASGAAGTWNFSPFYLQNAVQFDRIVHAVSITASTSTTCSHSLSMSFGIYTRSNNSTLNLLTSGTTSAAYTLSGSANSTLHHGWKLFTIPLTTTLAPGNYWFALGSRVSTAGGNGTIGNGMLSSSAPPSSGLALFSVATNATVQMELGRGGFSGTTNTFANSVHFSAIQGSISVHQRDPFILFASGTV